MAMAEPAQETQEQKPRRLVHDEQLDPDSMAPTVSADYFFDDRGLQDYTLAPEITRIAVALIQARPHELGHLRQFDIDYLWAQTLGTRNGWPIAVKALRIKGLAAYYAKRIPDVVLIWSVAFVQAGKLTRWELQALIHLLLRAVTVNDEGEPRLLPITPELEDELAAFYGAWSPRQKRLLAKLHADAQLSLFEEPEEGAAEDTQPTLFAEDDETEGGLVYTGALQ